MPKIHRFDSSGEAYDCSQCWGSIKDGDILSVPSERVVGVLIEAWPVAVSENSGEFHTPVETFDWESVPLSPWTSDAPRKNYSESFKMAVEELDRVCLQQTRELWG